MVLLVWYLHQAGQTGRQRRSVLRLFFYLCIHPFAYLLPNLWIWYFEDEWTDFDANWHKWSPRQGHETVNFGGQEVKGQGRTGSEIVLGRIDFLVYFVFLIISSGEQHGVQKNCRKRITLQEHSEGANSVKADAVLWCGEWSFVCIKCRSM